MTLIPLAGPGRAAGPPRVFADLPRHPDGEEGGKNLPDGMALDRDKRLWVAHYGMATVQVLSPEGRLLASYDTGMRCTSNICFAGPDLATAFVTGGDGEPSSRRPGSSGCGCSGTAYPAGWRVEGFSRNNIAR